MIYIFSNYSRTGKCIIDTSFSEKIDFSNDIFVHLNDCRFFANNINFFSMTNKNYVAMCNKSLFQKNLTLFINNKSIEELFIIRDNLIIKRNFTRSHIDKSQFLLAEDERYIYPEEKKFSTGFICYFFYHYYLKDDVTLVNFYHDQEKDASYIQKFSLKHDINSEDEYLKKMNARMIFI